MTSVITLESASNLREVDLVEIWVHELGEIVGGHDLGIALLKRGVRLYVKLHSP